MHAVDLIAKKRDGKALASAEIDWLVQGFVAGTVPDYQMAAWLMAVVWRGLTDGETFALTEAMVKSGDTLDLSGLAGIPVDKHSTGGVGDKTTLAVAPILASAGVPVAKMSGRGLGHTGGTLDKLESIPGLRTQFSADEILAQIRSVGACVCAQTPRLVPADHKMYALRDSTATVESLPLIAASIMSKKIAGGSQALVLDVKVGRGAFMKTLGDARALAELMIKIGHAHGQRVVAVLSSMDSPLGRNIGNWLEVEEVCRLLQNEPDAEPRLNAIARYLSAAAFVAAGRAATVAEGEELAVKQIGSGSAFEKFCEIAAAQGGDPAYLDQRKTIPQAAVRQEVSALREGWISRIDAKAIGLAAMRLGAGRTVKEDRIDPTAGIVLNAAFGAQVRAGDALATLHTSRNSLAQEVLAEVVEAITIADQPSVEPPLIYESHGL